MRALVLAMLLGCGAKGADGTVSGEPPPSLDHDVGRWTVFDQRWFVPAHRDDTRRIEKVGDTRHLDGRTVLVRITSAEAVSELAAVTGPVSIEVAGPFLADPVVRSGIESIGSKHPLALWPVGATDEHMVALSTLSTLEVLVLDETRISGRGLEHVGNSGLPNLVMIRIDGGDVSAAGIASLAKLPALRVLHLSSLENDAALEGIGQVPQLRSLNLKQARVSTERLAMLAKLPRLEALDLEEARLEPGAMTVVGRMKQLRALDVDHALDDDASAAQLAGLVKLEELRAGHNQSLTDMRWLRGLTGLRRLDLGLAEMTDAKAEGLLPLVRLERLDLGSSAVGDGFWTKARYPQLVELDVGASELGNAGLARLVKSSPAIENLDISSTKVTAIAPVETLTRLTRLDLSSLPVTDADLARLVRMPSLRWLDITSTKVSQAAADRIPSTIEVIAYNLE